MKNEECRMKKLGLGGTPGVIDGRVGPFTVPTPFAHGSDSSFYILHSSFRLAARHSFHAASPTAQGVPPDGVIDGRFTPAQFPLGLQRPARDAVIDRQTLSSDASLERFQSVGEARDVMW